MEDCFASCVMMSVRLGFSMQMHAYSISDSKVQRMIDYDELQDMRIWVNSRRFSDGKLTGWAGSDRRWF